MPIAVLPVALIVPVLLMPAAPEAHGDGDRRAARDAYRPVVADTRRDGALVDVDADGRAGCRALADRPVIDDGTGHQRVIGDKDGGDRSPLWIDLRTHRTTIDGDVAGLRRDREKKRRDRGGDKEFLDWILPRTRFERPLQWSSRCVPSRESPSLISTVAPQQLELALIFGLRLAMTGALIEPRGQARRERSVP